ncbi:branched-chain alpha-ketoacid dehydrogenase, partial [Gloeopeniophorella convolvens]
ELPVHLAHRAKELDKLPHNLSSTPSIQKVKNWYAQSFEELINFPPVTLPPDIIAALDQPDAKVPESTSNLSVDEHHYSASSGANRNGGGRGCASQSRSGARRYYVWTTNTEWPPEVHDYNKRFTRTLDAIKHQHDPTVMTVAQGVLEWKQGARTQCIGLDVQAWLDRFYMLRISIHFLISQHIALNTLSAHPEYIGIICARSVRTRPAPLLSVCRDPPRRRK